MLPHTADHICRCAVIQVRTACNICVPLSVLMPTTSMPSCWASACASSLHETGTMGIGASQSLPICSDGPCRRSKLCVAMQMMRMGATTCSSLVLTVSSSMTSF